MRVAAATLKAKDDDDGYHSGRQEEADVHDPEAGDVLGVALVGQSRPW
jgi:hypothetical protein